MRKFIKEQILEIFKTLYEAHSSVRTYIEKKETDNAVSVLGECQNTAVQIGDIIDGSEGEGSPVIHLLEEYCETVYQVSVGVSENITGIKAKKMLDKSLLKAENSVKNDIKVRLEIVFMPYKASMWDSLEGEWKEKSKDPNCSTYIVPIPYYDRNPDLSFGAFHYEGNSFPEEIPIIHYNDYDLESRRPDEIYIHNPYDDTNYVTSVEPRFYSRELKKYTNRLVYIPYFVLTEGAPTEQFSTVPACVYADTVILQSEKIRTEYIRNYSQAFGNSYGDPEKKFIVKNSSKIEKSANDSKSDYTLPEKWTNLIGKKKTILYNTSLSTMLQNSDKYLIKLKWVLNYFQDHNEVVLWWRPHPLMRATINSMRHDLLTEYDSIVNDYIAAGYGIFDDTADLHRAIAYSDGYYGDWSSLVEMYKATKKPIMIQNIEITDYI